MKKTMLLALVAATCLTSACGKDSKKKDKSTVLHLETGDGYCFEVIKEQMEAHGEPVFEELVAGACPQQLTVPGIGPVTRYAACASTTDFGTPLTTVVYSKVLSEEGDIIDMTLYSPQRLCEFAD